MPVVGMLPPSLRHGTSLKSSETYPAAAPPVTLPAHT